MALRETHVEIDFISDTSGLRDIQRESNNVLREMQYLRNEFDMQGTRMNDLSDESRAMMREMRNDWHMQRMNANKYRDELIRVQYGYHQLAKNAGEYDGMTKQYFRRIRQMGAIHKSITDAMMENDDRRKAKFIQNIGTMANASSRAGKILETYGQLGNPIYKLATGTLLVAQGLDRMAASARPAAIALKMLGPSASMKQLNDRTRQIQQGLGALPLIIMGAAFANFFLMRGLHQAATKTIPGYESAFKTMGATVRKAFQPMVEVFAMVMVPLYKFITAIFQLVVAFNQAHPLAARIIQAIILLAVVLTLVLAPLSIGIGLWYGYAAAFGLLWTMIKPIAIGLAAMSPIVWAVAAAIVLATVAINHLWKTNEGFRNAVIGAWDAIRSKAQQVFGWLGSFIAPIFDAIVAKLKQFATIVKQVFSGDFSQIGEVFKQLLPTIIGFLVGGLPGLLIAASRFIPTIVQGIQSQSANIATTATNIINNFVTFITTQLPRLVTTGVNILTNIVQGIVTALPKIITAVLQLLTFIVTTITTLLPVLLQAGVQILTGIINAIVTNLPRLVTMGVRILTTLIQGIITMLPMLLQAGLQILMGLVNAIVMALPLILNAALKILMALVNGIMTLLPTLIPVAYQIIMSLVNMIVTNLPLILAAGIKILTSLIQGITQMLPTLVTAAINLITQFSTSIITQLPTIIQSGVTLIIALVQGLIQSLPQIVSAALQLVLAIVNTLIENVPALLQAGVKLIMALLQGINQMKDAIFQAILDIGSGILDSILSIDLSSAGSDMMTGFLNGITSMKDSIISTAQGIAESAMGAIEGFLGIASPSKELFKIGAWTTEGMALGMQKQQPMVTTASESIASAAMHSPEQTVSNTRTQQRSSISFSPVYNITTNGSDSGDSIKQQLDEHSNDMFATLTDLFGTEVAY